MSAELLLFRIFRFSKTLDMAKIFVAGANGATGRRLVKELLNRGETLRVLVRSRRGAGFPELPQLEVVEANLMELTDSELVDLVDGCSAVACCLGHNLSFKGIFGPPRRLVTMAVRRLSLAIEASLPGAPVKFVLMNTSGNRNRDLKETLSIPHRMVLGLMRLLLPPLADNEQAAEHLRVQVGQDHPFIHWVTVRPDTLVNEEQVSPYECHPSPIRDPLFNAGKVSRINVAHFMASLITDPKLWDRWKGQMPVIYTSEA